MSVTNTCFVLHRHGTSSAGVTSTGSDRQETKSTTLHLNSRQAALLSTYCKSHIASYGFAPDVPRQELQTGSADHRSLYTSRASRLQCTRVGHINGHHYRASNQSSSQTCHTIISSRQTCCQRPCSERAIKSLSLQRESQHHPCNEKARRPS